jgi:hypothetical protein
MIEELDVFQNLEEENEYPKDMANRCREKNEFLDRRKDKGIINKGASVSIKENGDITLAASKDSQYKLSKGQGIATEISLQSNTITNRKTIKTDEIIVNKHKLNPQLWELADNVRLQDNSEQAIGNLTMMANVLVKAWEPNLKRYVMIRRQMRIPMFYPTLNSADAPEEMSIDSDITEELLKEYQEGDE